MSVAIDFKSVSKDIQGRWRKRRILHDLTFQVQEGQVVGLVGHNGAGKSSTMRILIGASWPSAGHVEVLGRAPRTLEARGALGFAAEHAMLPATLTARELVTMHCRLLGLDPAVVDPTLERAGFKTDSRNHIGGYSKGMAQRLSLALATLGAPRLLLLDEPMSGLDPIGRARVREMILEERKRGATIVFSSHVLADVAALCDRVLVLREGHLVLDEPIVGTTRSDGWRVALAEPVSDLPAGLEGARREPGDRAVIVPADHDVWTACRRLEEAGHVVTSVTSALMNLEGRVLPLLEHSNDG